MNGYFKLIMNEKGVLLHLFPETDGGEPVAAVDIMDYLDLQKIPFDRNLVLSGIQSHQETVVPLCREVKPPVRECAVIRVAPDKMSATMRFYPPSVGGSLMDREEILSDLSFQGIVFGIQNQEIDSFLAKREYCRNYTVALGESSVPGTDASIEYFFNTDLKMRPTLKDDGSVDFFNLNIMNHCKEGDVLAKLTPQQEGKAGSNVYGERLSPPPVKKQILRFGRNIAISEDKTTLTSEVNGHVMLVDNRVFVSNVYEVENVDNSTGNIEYEGSIRVRGNVCANFHVKAEGDIEVNGVVEGAFLEAGGNIIIGRGMNGMERGTLKAGGNIVAKFLENANASAKGYVEAEAILHSHVMAGTEVIVSGRKAFITGGTVSAGKEITAKTIGSSMAAATTVEVGVDPTIKERSQELQKEIQELQQYLRQIDPVITATVQKLKQGVKLPPEQTSYMKALAASSKEQHEKLEADIKESEELRVLLEETSESSVVVTDVIYPGTKVVISGVSLMVKEPYKFCRFKKIRGDVKAVTL